MKTYTKLDTKEAFNNAMDAGKPIQYWNVDEWVTKQPGSGFCNNIKYRIVEETKRPEQGDEIMVWDINESLAVKRVFVVFWGSKAVASVDKDSSAVTWNHWKPIDKKPEPREWLVNEASLEKNDVNNILASPDIVLAPGAINRLVIVREVLED